MSVTICLRSLHFSARIATSVRQIRITKHSRESTFTAYTVATHPATITNRESAWNPLVPLSFLTVTDTDLLASRLSHISILINRICHSARQIQVSTDRPSLIGSAIVLVTTPIYNHEHCRGSFWQGQIASRASQTTSENAAESAKGARSRAHKT